MKLWGGRFTKEENQLVHNFNESLSFDQKFYEQDIRGSLAHAAMLARQGIRDTVRQVSDLDPGVPEEKLVLDLIVNAYLDICGRDPLAEQD